MLENEACGSGLSWVAKEVLDKVVGACWLKDSKSWILIFILPQTQLTGLEYVT